MTVGKLLYHIRPPARKNSDYVQVRSGDDRLIATSTRFLKSKALVYLKTHFAVTFIANKHDGTAIAYHAHVIQPWEGGFSAVHAAQIPIHKALDLIERHKKIDREAVLASIKTYEHLGCMITHRFNTHSENWDMWSKIHVFRRPNGSLQFKYSPDDSTGFLPTKNDLYPLGDFERKNHWGPDAHEYRRVSTLPEDVYAQIIHKYVVEDL